MQITQSGYKPMRRIGPFRSGKDHRAGSSDYFSRTSCSHVEGRMNDQQYGCRRRGAWRRGDDRAKGGGTAEALASPPSITFSLFGGTLWGAPRSGLQLVVAVAGAAMAVVAA